MNNDDYYGDLGLTEYATEAEIKSAFHALAKQCHPDKTGTNDATVFRRVRQAYNVLSDPLSRAAYDRGYKKTRALTAEYETGESARSRTAQYEAEQAAETAEYEHDQDPEQANAATYEERLRRSPPPVKPTRKPGETGTSYFLGKAYLAWEKRLAKYREVHPWYDQGPSYFSQAASGPSSPTSSGSAHGLIVKMSSHPATAQHCTLRTTEWRVQMGGTEICVFCLTPVEKGGCRCPGCEVMACNACLRKIIDHERRGAFGGFGSKMQYGPSGG